MSARRSRSGEARGRPAHAGGGSRLYVYALVDRKLPALKVSGRTIEAVQVGHLYAMAQRTEHAPVISEEALREQYDVVLELHERTAAILPARFGSLVDYAELTRIVTLRHAQLAAALDLVRNREQMTVRLIGSAATPDAADRRVPAGAARPGTRYLEERRAAAGYPLPEAAARLTAAVRSLIVADKAEPGEGNVRGILHHLIERRSSAAYCRALALAASDVDFPVKVTGPWPPFAFVPELLG